MLYGKMTTQCGTDSVKIARLAAVCRALINDVRVNAENTETQRVAGINGSDREKIERGRGARAE